MRGTYKYLAVLCILLLGYSHSASADNLSTGLQQKFNWQTAWGGIDFSGTNDKGIPASQFQPKADIKRVIQLMGTQSTDLSSLKVFSTAINDDDKQDFVIDGTGYFPQYQSPSAPYAICTDADGCFVSLYITGPSTNLISESTPPAPTCPKTAAENTTCIASCAATEQTCPALFQYNTRTVFSQQVLKWNFISAADFQQWATGTSYNLANANPVFVALRNNTNCYMDEIATNNNQCIKYYQYVGDYGTGTLVDLYDYVDLSSMVPQYDTRFTHTPFERTSAHLARGSVIGTGFGHRFNAGSSIDIQIKNFVRTNPDNSLSPPVFATFHIENHSTKDLFIPANTDKEFSSFLNAAQRLNVLVETEHLHFTPWVGDTQCPAGLTAPENIAAQRFCQSSTSDYRTCQACIDAKVPGFEDGCSKAQSCTVDACIVDYAPPWPDDLRLYTGTYVSLNECKAEASQYYGQTITGNVGSFPHNYWLGNNAWQNAHPSSPYATPINDNWCDNVFAYLCANGHLCLSGDALISLPNGETKRIDQIKAGDMVLGFTTPKDDLKPYKVKKLAITKESKLINLNDLLKLTPNHLVVTSDGRKVEASKLKVGDKLLQGDGTTLEIKTLHPEAATSTVYNLQFDEAGSGFVADGIRVVGYVK